MPSPTSPSLPAALHRLFFKLILLSSVSSVVSICPDAVVGPVERGGHAGRAEPRRRKATLGFRIISGGFPFYAAGYVLTQSFNGAGDTVTPTLINLGCFWLFEIPLSYGLGRSLGYGPPGVFWAMAIAFSVMSVVSAWLFRRGRWKLKRDVLSARARTTQ